MGNDVFLYRIRRSPETLDALKSAETRSRGGTLSSDLPEFADFTWISTPGIHYGIDENDEIRLAIRITYVEFSDASLSWDKVSKEWLEVQDTIQEWTTLAQEITTNVAAGAGTTREASAKRRGHMWGVGWHQSMQENTTAASYAPLRETWAKKRLVFSLLGRKERLMMRQRMRELEEDGSLKKVSEVYLKGFGSLVPGPQQAVIDIAELFNIPSFANHRWKGEMTDFTGANAMTITNGGFSNCVHCDNDFCSIVYGAWWVAEQFYRSLQPGQKKERYGYRHNPLFDHKDIKGGEFIWGQYNIGVKFDRCLVNRAEGLVECMWMGSEDAHASLLSLDPGGCTRFGSSIQLTRRGVNAVNAVRRYDEDVMPTRVKGTDMY
ncbi:hypothetical protein CYLTODRAFT_415312 [Cylindrobasidium torrendii FP15055 ss-10]|uniref:Tet-like 2OG-Fe(II) oxygenase domain-containing protein n=1 Tax=Cylindrobasidium torrendii FP15055 ss-10 TaxID=1314674 RepID=A0A0D7AUV0_9AGAR|nr:hypothetical protein CYLTODRAFT_415312 [Cylindrobasidium torrendii FP15055 ss-10]